MNYKKKIKKKEIHIKVSENPKKGVVITRGASGITRGPSGTNFIKMFC